MSLRLKLVLAQLPLAFALVLVGLVSVLIVESLADTSRRILQDNYRSVLAAQRMKESAERMDSAAMFRIAGAPDKADAMVATHRPALEAELGGQEENITEPGEAAITVRLRRAWTDYLVAYDVFTARPSSREYFAELEPRFVVLKDTADEVLSINQDAMLRKSEAARRNAERAETVVTWSSLGALLLGLLASYSITTRLLRPLDNLSLVARRLGEGELSVRANVMGRDELAAVAREFNEMAKKLEAFRKSSLGELLQAQLSAQAAIDSIPDPVVVFGIAGQVLTSNTRADAVLALEPAQSIGDALALVDPALRGVLQHARDHVLAGKGPYLPKGFEEAVMVGSAEGERWYLPRASPLYGEDAGVTGVTVIVQDVTRLRRFDELRNNLMATVAHELRTPLTSLRMAIHLCVEGAAGALGDKQLDLLGAAREDCERLQSIVDDLLDLTRLQAGELELEREPARPEALVEQSVDAHRSDAERRGVRVETRVTPSLDDVPVDRTRIALVLDNLLANALRYAPAGSVVTIAAQPQPGAVRFSVADAGPGIPREYQSRVFDRFFRIPSAGASGAGLGLSIARDVVEAHGGEIGVVSPGVAGDGASFWFTLPLVAAGRGGVATAGDPDR
jgi:two-component system, NtrC family, sensor histidine kinase KinB